MPLTFFQTNQVERVRVEYLVLIDKINRDFVQQALQINACYF